MASRRSGDSAVLFAITRIRAMWRNLVRREIRVPVAEGAERSPELALRAAVVERGVDVWAPDRLAAWRQPLNLTRSRGDPPPKRHADVVQLLERLVAHHHDHARLNDRQLLHHTSAALGRRLVGVTDRALHEDGPVDSERIDAQALEALHQGAPGAA